MQTFTTIALIVLSIAVSFVDALPPATCVSNFLRRFDNPTSASFTITSSFPEPAAFMYASVDVLGTSHSDQKLWCIDYDQSVDTNTEYPASLVYTYEYVLAHPDAVTGINRPSRLNQAAFLLNDVVIGTTVASPTAQTWWGKTYTGCSTITTSDFQAALWALLQSAGECDRSTGGDLCTNALSDVNPCNVAYLWNLAFANVPENTNYYIPTTSCAHSVVYPLVLIPEPPITQTTQVQIIAVDINSWGASPQCACPQTTYSCGRTGPDGSPAQKDCQAGFYCPAGSTASTPIVPVSCPAGFHCPRGSCSPLECECGHKCPAGSSEQIECQPPFYCPGKGNANMTLCPAGSMCDQPRMCAPTPCPPGTYVSCAGKKSCDACPAGRYCSTAASSVLCPAGSYCPRGASAPAQCPASRFCPVGSARPKDCPAGTTSAAGSASAQQCA